MPLQNLRLVGFRRKGACNSQINQLPLFGAAFPCSSIRLPPDLPPAEPAIVDLTLHFLRPLSSFLPTVRSAILQDGGRNHARKHGHRHVHGHKGHHDLCLLGRAARYVKGFSHRIGHVLGFPRPPQGSHMPHKKDGYQHGQDHAAHNRRALPIVVADMAVPHVQ